MLTLRYLCFLSGLLAANLSMQVAAQSTNPLPAPSQCPEERLFDAALTPLVQPPRAIELDGQTRITSNGFRVDVNGEAAIHGDVKIEQGTRVLKADELRVDRNTNSMELRGKVEFSDPALVVRGNVGRFLGGEAQFEGSEFELPQQPARGTARSLTLNREGVLKLAGVSYTTCPVGHNDWGIRAGSVSLNTKERVGIARDARVEFMGVPIIRLPWISFPIGNVRKSGFLFPGLGNSSRGGAQLAAPYYFNLAPNYDLTFTPTVFTRRGLDLGAEARHLSSSGQATVLANFLPNDNVLNSSRSRVKLQSVHELPGNWRVAVDAENVSDSQYYEDFSQGSEGASIAFLPRRLRVSYRDATWKMGALVQNFQTIDQGLASANRPYSEIPRLYASGNWQVSGLPLEYGFDSEAVAFQRNIGIEGFRLNVAPQASLHLGAPGYFLTPALALQGTQYRLRNTPSGIEKNPTRVLPIASLDGGLFFERASGKRGQRRITLEPRLMYLYVPYRNQNDLPVFDTTEPDLNWVELFRTNRYVGIDRVSDANQMSLGITSRLFGSDNGTRYLSATLGQTFHFDAPRVTLPGEVSNNGKSSDLIAQLQLNAFKDWTVDLGLQWDHQQSRSEKSEIRLQYSPDAKRVVNLGYRYQRDRLEQADVSAAWPIANNWSLYSRMLYSVRDGESIEKFAGFEYSSCCWGLRAVARNYVSRRSGERDTGIYLQLELKGLSNVGLAADAFLERAIRGYSASGRPR
jgi:LPS-assembly protein